MEQALTLNGLRDFLRFCETDFYSHGKIGSQSFDNWVKSKEPKDYGQAIMERGVVVSFKRKNDGMIVNIGDTVITSAWGTRMGGTVISITHEGLVKFKNAYPNGNDVDRWINDIDLWKSGTNTHADIFSWLKS